MAPMRPVRRGTADGSPEVNASHTYRRHACTGRGACYNGHPHGTAAPRSPRNREEPHVHVRHPVSVRTDDLARTGRRPPRRARVQLRAGGRVRARAPRSGPTLEAMLSCCPRDSGPAWAGTSETCGAISGAVLALSQLNSAGTADVGHDEGRRRTGWSASWCTVLRRDERHDPLRASSRAVGCARRPAAQLRRVASRTR